MNHIQKLLLLTALLSSSMAFGQLTEDPEDRRNQGRDELKTQTPEGRPLPFGQRLRFGGGITGLRFGVPTSIGASPVVAYQAAERLILGVAVSYTYTRWKPGYLLANQGVTYNQYGGRGFAMYEFIPGILKNLYLHGEVEQTSIQQKIDNKAGSYTQSLTSPLVGLTYSQPISRRLAFNLTALYNLNYTGSAVARQIYSSPLVFRVAFF